MGQLGNVWSTRCNIRHKEDVRYVRTQEIGQLGTVWSTRCNIRHEEDVRYVRAQEMGQLGTVFYHQVQHTTPQLCEGQISVPQLTTLKGSVIIVEKSSVHTNILHL